LTQITQRDIYGLTLEAWTREDLERRIVRNVTSDIGGWLVTANLEFLRQFQDSDEIRELLSAADIVVADGMPLVWASRIARRALPERVAGSDLINTLSARAAENRQSVFLLGGSDGAAREAAGRLAGLNPSLAIAGTASPRPGFEQSPATVSRLIEQVAGSRPDIVFVGLGFPKQERLISEMRGVMPSTWFIGCGVSIDFVAGYVERAPEWSHRLGLEWIFRLIREPRKLFRRYIVDGLPFAVRLAKWAVTARWNASRSATLAGVRHG
jgi:N-acetylglucosaminyldiphosphoundecaprenol N-acetyl-beta-D-mannosaminyltransferase